MRRPAELDDLDRKRPVPPPVAPTYIRPMGVREALKQDFERARAEADKMRAEFEQARLEAYEKGYISRGEYHRIEHYHIERRGWTPGQRWFAWWIAALVAAIVVVAVR